MFPTVLSSLIAVLCPGAAPSPGLRPLAPAAGLYWTDDPRAPGVCSLEEDLPLRLETFPDDPPSDPRWADQDNLAGPGSIHADDAWAIELGRADTVIAVLDTGVDALHEDLYLQLALNAGELEGLIDADLDGILTMDDAAAVENAHLVADGNGNGRIDREDLADAFEDGIDDDDDGFVDNISGWDFEDGDNDVTDADVNGHGTFVGGLAGARANNATGTAGVCPGCRLLYLRIGRMPLVMASGLAQGVVYAVDHGASVLHMSLGATMASPALDAAFRYAHERGVFAAAAIGNEHLFHANVPATSPEVFAVGALTRADDPWTERAGYSNYGPHLFVMAPSEVPTPAPGDSYIECGGTSCATPHVSGTAALLAAHARRMRLDPVLLPDEIAQLLRVTAVDLVGGEDDAAAGWDPWTGYGRIDAAAALVALGAGEIPPVARIETPAWYVQVDPGRTPMLEVAATIAAPRSDSVSWQLELGLGTEPESWTDVASGQAERSTDVTATIDLAELELPTPRWDAEERRLPENYLVSLRLRATDGQGRVGEARRAFTVRPDPNVHSGFPVDLGGGVVASPALADLDADGRVEVIVVTSDGVVHVLDADGEELDGYPTAVGQEGMTDVLASPAVGDIDGDGSPEIVVATIQGEVHALSNGASLDGWPVWLGEMIIGTPALSDLDGDESTDVVVAVYDGQIHALGASGAELSGWPVLAKDKGEDDPQVGGTSASPAIGDLDGDGDVEVVVGSGEAYGSQYDQHGRLYSWSGQGSPVEGWPIEPPALQAQPGFFLFTGVTSGASLADLDGDGTLEAAVGALSGTGAIYGADGHEVATLSTDGWGEGSDVPADSSIWVAGIAAIGDIDADGDLDVAAPLIGLSSIFSRFPSFMLGGWTAEGHWLSAFPRAQEGLALLMNPAIADLDGDGNPEVIVGSSGRVLHAVDAQGREPEGWPKNLGDFLAPSPAAWDLDADGLIETVAVTGGGRLHVWDETGALERADGSIAVPWPMFRHDATRTGNLHTELGLPVHPAPPPDLEPKAGAHWIASGGGFGCAAMPHDPSNGPLLVALLVVAVACRPRRRCP